MKRFAAVGALMAGAMLLPDATAADPDPFSCTGYPEPRVFLESQAWWTDSETLTDGDTEHAHSGTCFPLNQTLTGNVTFDVVSRLHNANGHYLRYVRVQSATKQGGAKTLQYVIPRQLCASDDCLFVTSFTIDTSQLKTGRHEFRIHTVSSPIPGYGGAELLATNGWQACVRSCAGVTPQATDFPEGRGWYSKDGQVRGYINGRFDQTLPSTVSGMWCPRLRVLQGAGDEPVEDSRVVIDPDFHHGYGGTVLLTRRGPFTGNPCIDTTALAEGPHRLVLIAHTTSGFPGQLWGVLVLPFTVDN